MRRMGFDTVFGGCAVIVSSCTLQTACHGCRSVSIDKSFVRLVFRGIASAHTPTKVCPANDWPSAVKRTKTWLGCSERRPNSDLRDARGHVIRPLRVQRRADVLRQEIGR